MKGIRIGKYNIDIPIIQGGMGVGVSWTSWPVLFLHLEDLVLLVQYAAVIIKTCSLLINRLTGDRLIL